MLDKSVGIIPSRRSPSSTMSRTPCIRPVYCAACESFRMTSSSVLKLVSAWAMTLSTWLSMGERISIMFADKPASRMAAIFSIRESPSELTPTPSNALAILAEPSVALVIPVTEMPCTASRLTSVCALWEILSRSISSQGAVTAWSRSACVQFLETLKVPFPPVARVTGSGHRWRECPVRADCL